MPTTIDTQSIVDEKYNGRPFIDIAGLPKNVITLYNTIDPRKPKVDDLISLLYKCANLSTRISAELQFLDKLSGEGNEQNHSRIDDLITMANKTTMLLRDTFIHIVHAICFFGSANDTMILYDSIINKSLTRKELAAKYNRSIAYVDTLLEKFYASTSQPLDKYELTGDVK